MDRAQLAGLPKAELHNHLDGGLRVTTVLELAEDLGYRDLPTTDPAELAAWFYRGDAGSLEAYLEGFTHTIAVLQTAAALERVAFEAGEDLAADGVVYGEIRYAPRHSMRLGLRREDVIEATVAGLRRAERATGVTLGLIVDAMRDEPDSLLDARAAVRFAGAGVVGFDLAGPEAGYPPDDHLPACRLARSYGLGLTLHAGEGAGVSSIAAAVTRCGARRIGHGVRIIEDTETAAGEVVALGGVARLVRDLRIPLELCPTSNLHTMGIAPSAHPLGALHRAGFNVTLSTDNRLMSRTTLTDEFLFAATHHGFTRSDLGRATVAALEAGFGDWSVRRSLLDRVAAAYAAN
jgi:adenosine deaminase